MGQCLFQFPRSTGSSSCVLRGGPTHQNQDVSTTCCSYLSKFIPLGLYTSFDRYSCLTGSINWIDSGIKWIKQEYRHCEKKLARLLFDFGVITKMLSTQQTMIVSNRFRRSHSVDNSWQQSRCDDGRRPILFATAVVWRQIEQEVILIFKHIFFKLWNLNIFRERLEEDLNAATESAAQTCIHCVPK